MDVNTFKCMVKIFFSDASCPFRAVVSDLVGDLSKSSFGNGKVSQAVLRQMLDVVRGLLIIIKGENIIHTACNIFV